MFFCGVESYLGSPKPRFSRHDVADKAFYKAFLFSKGGRSAFKKPERQSTGPPERAGRQATQERRRRRATASRSHPAVQSPIRRLNVAGSGGIPANGVRPTIRLRTAEKCHTQRGTTSQASAATGRLSTRWHSYLVTDAASPCLSQPPTRPATCARTMHARRRERRGANRLADDTTGDHECQRLPLRARPGVFVAQPRRDVTPLSMSPAGTIPRLTQSRRL